MEESSASGSGANLKATAPPGKKGGQSFEWIPHGDASARKRARAHVTRGFRREKAAQATREKEERKRRDNSSPSSSSLGASQTTATAADVIAFRPCRTVSKPEAPKAPDQELVLPQTIGSGRTDPFSIFPVELNPRAHVLLDHFLTGGIVPYSFSQDRHASLQPLQGLAFQISLSDPSAFHVILAAAANDIAARSGQSDSPDVNLHQSLAFSLMNKRLRQKRITDGGIAAVALLICIELFLGNIEGFNTHMQGLKSMVKLRGGMHLLQKTNPQLYSLVSWCDYSGSCNLISRPLFDSGTSSSRLLYSDPSAIPENILRRLPSEYDFCQTTADIFTGLLALTTCLRTRAYDSAQYSESLAFIARVDSSLRASILMPAREGPLSRRRNIKQSLEILALIYATLVSIRYPCKEKGRGRGASLEMFLTRLKVVVTGEAVEWGLTVVNLFQYLLAGEGRDPDAFSAQIWSFYDACMPLTWLPWLAIKNSLLEFFVYDSACEGPLQALWQEKKCSIPS